MSEDRMIAIVGVLMVLVLIGSGLARRRLGPRSWLRLGTLWLAILLAAWAAAALIQSITHHDFT